MDKEEHMKRIGKKKNKRRGMDKGEHMKLKG
jgi:hypothetical protein